jgi:hypothetical protein
MRSEPASPHYCRIAGNHSPSELTPKAASREGKSYRLKEAAQRLAAKVKQD